MLCLLHSDLDMFVAPTCFTGVFSFCCVAEAADRTKLETAVGSLMLAPITACIAVFMLRTLRAAALH